MYEYLYCAIPEQFKGKNVIKFGKTNNLKSRFRDYGNLEIIKTAEVKDVIRREKELHQLARIYFGKPAFHKEYYSCEDLEKAIEVFDEIINLKPDKSV
jgi:hypothetical protein